MDRNWMMAMVAMADRKPMLPKRRLTTTTTTLYAYVDGDGTLKQAGQEILIEKTGMTATATFPQSRTKLSNFGTTS